MTPQETLLLLRYVKACCPQQAMDEYTPDAWHDLLGDLSFADCKDAAKTVAQRQPFVAPSEIRDAVREIRGARLDRTPLPPAPPEIAADGRAYAEWKAEQTRRIADGETELRALPGGGGRD